MAIRMTANHLVVMFSAWKAKIRVRVARRATGWKRERKFSLNHCSPLALMRK